MLSSFDDDRCMQGPNFCEPISLGTKNCLHFTHHTYCDGVRYSTSAFFFFFFPFFLGELRYVNESYDAAVITIYNIISYKNRWSIDIRSCKWYMLRNFSIRAQTKFVIQSCNWNFFYKCYSTVLLL